MAETPAEPRRIIWSEWFAFPAIFRSFGVAIDWRQLALAFIGILLTYLAGRTLDAVWPEKHSVMVLPGGVTEVSVYAMEGGDSRDSAMQLLRETGAVRGAERIGIFSALLTFVRERVNLAVDSILQLDPRMLLGVLIGGLLALVWLITAHLWYALIFLSISLLIWAYCGGGITRLAALRITRDERVGFSEATQFARAKFIDFVVAPIFPFLLVVAAGFVLFLGGLVGLIPWLGDFLVGLLFFIAILIGLLMALLVIGGVSGCSLLFPSIAVENSDCFDAFGRSFAFIYERPWKAAWYMLVAIGYGAICLVFIKLVVRIGLWITFACLGFSMNWAGPSGGTENPPPKEMRKLESMWQAPSLGYQNQFIGNPPPHELGWPGAMGQFLIKSWIYVLWAAVAAFVVSFYYSASTIIYLLLRREVDATDFEEIYLEEISAGEPGAKPAGGQTSLPVIGQ